MQKTVIILAGGKGQRFQASDKCFITLNNKPLIQHAIDSLSSVADEIIVAARDEQQGEQIRDAIPNNTVLVFDTLKDFGPLAGVLSGLERASSSYSLVIGCDMPFVNRYVVEFLFEVAERGNYDAVVPRWESGMVEQLHAVYKREPMLAAIRDSIKKGDAKIFNVLSRLKNVNYIPMNTIRGIDTELITFRNINTPEELEKLRITG
ncbi:MAG TPA: molybdenum cofactor guanylyltransferase [Candidatus Bathyarchaeia archaeon]|nr:molybdenum cofactor guanylyltransferase [Candidatus Bathyarchaeia archaeon]